MAKKPKFSWDDQQDAPSQAPTKGGKFSWDDQADAEPHEPSPGLIERAAGGLSDVARAVDSYTGAPARAALGALQDGKGVTGSIGAGYDQLGENPDLAPTGKQIALKAGLSDRAVLPGNVSFASAKGGEVSEPDIRRNPSFADIGGLGIEMAADLTNLIPVAKAGKALGSGAVRGTERAIKGAAQVAESGERLAARAGGRAIEAGLGAPVETQAFYRENLGRLKDKVGAKEMSEELAGRLDQGLKPARDRVALLETAVENAKARRSENLSELMLKRQEARDALKLAEAQSLGETASRVSGRVTQLDKEVKEGSSAAFDILDQEGVVVPTQALKARMTAGINALAERAVTDEQNAVVDLLKRYRERLDKFGSEIQGGEAKRILQSLDREIAHVAPGEVGRMSKPDQALGALRQHIDAPLKKSAAYAEQMKGVAADTRLLMDAKPLASESAAARALQAAGRATGKDQALLIRSLEAKYGDKFLESVARSNLPEYAKLKGVISQYRAAKKGLGVKAAEAGLESARATLGEASSLADGGLAGIKDKISAYTRSAQPGAKQAEALTQAGKIAGIDMPLELKDIKTIASFEKGYTRGSANTNFWGALAGGVAGSVLGPQGALGGAALGGAFGRMAVDSFGPAIARKILDQTPLLKKMSPAAWLSQLDVPAPVKKALTDDLNYYRIQRGARGSAAASKGGESVRRVAGDEPKGEERWARSGLQKLNLSDNAAGERLLQSKEARRLLIEASDLPEGSRALARVKERIEALSKGLTSDSLSGTPQALPRLQRKPSSGR